MKTLADQLLGESSELGSLLSKISPKLKQDIIAQVSRKRANDIRDNSKNPTKSYDDLIKTYIDNGHVTLFQIKYAAKNGTI